eukprot:COSAG03_NODE_478_length_7595_cov_4.439568_2_plen_97_part_00
MHPTTSIDCNSNCRLGVSVSYCTTQLCALLPAGSRSERYRCSFEVAIRGALLMTEGSAPDGSVAAGRRQRRQGSDPRGITPGASALVVLPLGIPQS